MKSWRKSRGRAEGPGRDAVLQRGGQGPAGMDASGDPRPGPSAGLSGAEVGKTSVDLTMK